MEAEAVEMVGGLPVGMVVATAAEGTGGAREEAGVGRMGGVWAVVGVRETGAAPAVVEAEEMGGGWVLASPVKEVVAVQWGRCQSEVPPNLVEGRNLCGTQVEVPCTAS